MEGLGLFFWKGEGGPREKGIILNPSDAGLRRGWTGGVGTQRLRNEEKDQESEIRENPKAVKWH